MKEFFVQIGATRDGREAYLGAAQHRGMHAVLVETAEYMALRRVAGRREFDSYLATSTPADPDAVLREIQTLDGTVRLVLGGFERYTACAHEVTARAGLAPPGPVFHPPSKLDQRLALRRNAPDILQPHFWSVAADSRQFLPSEVGYPAVLKPVNGGGGLGVLFVNGPEQLHKALDHGVHLCNYDNSPLQEWIVEEYIKGAEASVQGICCAGVCHVLAICSKVIRREPVSGLAVSTGFREVAHIATHPHSVPPPVLRFVERCVRAMAYRDGPFHIDFRQGSDGPVFIEMGFRLSGAAVTDLVWQVSGCDWGESAFSWMLGEGRPPHLTAGLTCVAHVLAFSECQIEAAKRAGGEYEIRIERFTSPCAGLSADEVRLLAADLSRHTGPIARIQIRGSNTASIQMLAEQLSTLESTERNNIHDEELECSGIPRR